MSVCVPDGTDWSCAFTEQELADVMATEAGAADIAVAEAYAWSLLASLTAYQIATCPITVRPCTAGCSSNEGMLAFPVMGGHTGALGGSGTGFNPHITGGSWVNSCGCKPSGCSCTMLSEVILPGPVGGIESVMIDGVLLPTTAYRVDNGSLLVRLDGEPWPDCQDMNAPADGEGAFAVRYYRGAAPNIMTNRAAGLLAAEFYQACAGNDCALPNSVVGVVRQGVEYELEPTDFPEGKTGIKAVDALIRIYNPYKRKAPTRIASPDAPLTRTTTWRA